MVRWYMVAFWAAFMLIFCGALAVALWLAIDMVRV